MGAFYQTASPQSVDFAYKLPAELMLKAIEAGDAQNDMQVSQLDVLNDAMAKVKMLDKDRARAKEILGGYQSQTDQFSADLYKNPQDWRKRMGDIRTLGRKLATDYTSGELAAIQGNYTDYMTWAKDEKARMDKGEISPEFYEAARKKYLNDFGGTNYNNETGTYDKINTAAIAKYVNIPERVNSYVKDMKANSKKVTQVNGKDMYLVKTTKGEKWMDEKEVRAVALMMASADTQATSYVNQGVGLGVFKSPESVWMPAINAAAMAQGFSESEYAEDISGDPVKIMKYEQAQTTARQNASQAFQAGQADKQHIWELQKEARGAQQAAHTNAIKEHNLNPASTQPIPESPYEGVDLGYGKTYSEGGAGDGTEGGPTSDQQKANMAALGMDFTGGYGTLPSDSTGVSPNIRAVQAGKAKPSSISENYLNVFSPEEMKPDVMRSQGIPMAQQNLVSAQARYNDALKTGNPGQIAAANAELTAAKSTLHMAQGIMANAENKYFQSKEFTSLDPKLQGQVRDYMSYLNVNKLKDNSTSRKQFAEASGLDYRKGLDYGLTLLEENLVNTSERGRNITKYIDQFDRAVNKASTFITDAATADPNSNKYQTKGVDIDFSDPTINSVLNTGFAGRVTMYDPHSRGGKTLAGDERGMQNYQLDPGFQLWGGLSGGKALTIPDLMKATGAKSYGELFEKGSILPSTNNHIRLQLKLKDQGPNGKDIGGNQSYYNQVEGLNANREIIVEFQDDATNRVIMERMRNDPNIEVRNVINTMYNPDNSALRSMYLNIPRPSSNNNEWGREESFGYGDASYNVRKNSDGRSETVIHFRDKGQNHTATFRHDQDAATEDDLTNFHEQYTNPNRDEWNNYMNQLRSGGFLDK